MVKVWIVGVRVDEGLVPVPVRVWFPRRIRGAVGVLMVSVMNMRVFMLQRFVVMFVLVAFGQVQP